MIIDMIELTTLVKSNKDLSNSDKSDVLAESEDMVEYLTVGTCCNNKFFRISRSNMKHLVLIIIGIFIAAGCHRTDTESSTITNKDMIEIANQALTKIGASLDVMQVEIDTNNEKWVDALFYLKTRNPGLAKKYDILKGRDYQAIHYIPDLNKVLGMGEIFVFIDRKTHEVITICAGT